MLLVFAGKFIKGWEPLHMTIGGLQRTVAYHKHTTVRWIQSNGQRLRLDGIAKDADLWDLQIYGVFDRVEVLDKQDQMVYSISVETFDRLKQEVDLGAGRQYLVPRGNWETQPYG